MSQPHHRLSVRDTIFQTTAEFGQDGHIILREYFQGELKIEFSLTRHESLQLAELVYLARGAQGLPLCPDSGPTPEVDGAVQAAPEERAKRCLDGPGNGGQSTALIDHDEWYMVRIVQMPGPPSHHPEVTCA